MKQSLNAFDEDFWQALDKLVAESELVIDRPEESRRPRFLFTMRPSVILVNEPKR